MCDPHVKKSIIVISHALFCFQPSIFYLHVDEKPVTYVRTFLIVGFTFHMQKFSFVCEKSQ